MFDLRISIDQKILRKLHPRSVSIFCASDFLPKATPLWALPRHDMVARTFFSSQLTFIPRGISRMPACRPAIEWMSHCDFIRAWVAPNHETMKNLTVVGKASSGCQYLWQHTWNLVGRNMCSFVCSIGKIAEVYN